MAEPWFSSSVIFITYDEAYDELGKENFSGYDGLLGGPVCAVAVSPYTLGMGTLSGNSSHDDLLTTTEWLRGLTGTGAGNDSTAAFPALMKRFHPRIFGPGADLQHTGLVGANLSGDDLRGADLGADNLQHANLARASLQGADLSAANLALANLTSAILTGLGSAAGQWTDFDGANLARAVLAGASCGSPNYIRAIGANIHAEEVPTACTPPL